MELSPEHAELAETVRRFARDEVAPVIADYYERAAFPYPVVAQMAEMGLFGLPFPEEYGGMGGDFLAFCLALEELARVDSSVAITLEAAVGLGAMPIYRFGTEDQTAAAVAARPVRRAGARRVRPDRARRRHRRRGHPDDGPPGRRRLGDRRDQGVHHELAGPTSRRS